MKGFFALLCIVSFFSGCVTKGYMRAVAEQQRAAQAQQNKK
jgi:outer membrane lipoprotein-sorting protein